MSPIIPSLAKHKIQDTNRLSSMVFLHMCNGRLLQVSMKYDANIVLNIDETNIDFDEMGRKTLAKVETRLMSGKINGHHGRATVVLCCSVSGEKLPAFVIWKVVPNGRIKSECQGP